MNNEKTSVITVKKPGQKNKIQVRQVKSCRTSVCASPEGKSDLWKEIDSERKSTALQLTQSLLKKKERNIPFRLAKTTDSNKSSNRHSLDNVNSIDEIDRSEEDYSCIDFNVDKIEFSSDISVERAETPCLRSDNFF